MCAAAMFGRCWSSQSGKIDSERAWANRATSKLPSEPTLRKIGGDQLADVYGRDPGSHADPEPRRVQLFGLQARIRDRHRRPRPRRIGPPGSSASGSSCARPDRAAHRSSLTSPAILILRPVGVEALDVVHPGPPLKDGLAELATADPVGRDNTDSGYDHAVHWFPHALSSLYHR